MSVIIQTALYDAMETSLLQVECSYTRGFVGLQLVGHTSEVCKNGLERARTALEDTGIQIPQKRIVVSISPADSKKEGNHFDLPFAVGLALLITDKKSSIDLSRWLFAAELTLEGRLRPVKGVISFAVEALSQGLEGVIISKDNLQEMEAFSRLNLSSMKNFNALAFESIKDVMEWVWDGCVSKACALPSPPQIQGLSHSSSYHHFDDMLLDHELKKIALVVASGLHSLLLYGTPGTGKSMFSSRLSSIMPVMEQAHHLESLKIHSSYSHSLPIELLLGVPPFRAPHHQASSAAIMGLPEHPGEISLAHGGILFLDEFPEFRRDLIEALREPLETGKVRVSRAKKKVIWNSEITLIAACNGCPCGWLGSKRKKCVCPINKIQAYRRKLSGPILDRIDLHVNLKEMVISKSSLFLQLEERKKQVEKQSQTQELARLVLAARQFAAERNQQFGVLYNRDLKVDHILRASGMDSPSFQSVVDEVIPQGSGKRAIIRSLRVARTLADLEQRSSIEKEDLIQACRWLPEASAKERGDQAYGV